MRFINFRDAGRYVGETLTRQQARRELEALGLSVTAVTSLGHVPRAPAIWLTFLIDRLGRPGLLAGLQP